MAAVASLEQLQQAQRDLEVAVNSGRLTDYLNAESHWGPKVGWKNVAHMVHYGKTPEQLKEGR